MADDNTKKFSDTIDKLANTATKLDKAAMILARSTKSKGSASAEEKREGNQMAKENNAYLSTIAAAMGSIPDAGSESSGDKKSGGIFASIAKAVGGIGSGIGRLVSGFMTGMAAGVASIGPFILVMGGLGTGIAAFMAPLVLGMALYTKAFPTIIAGMKGFEVLDGKKLEEVGIGMGAMGLGLGAQGFGGAMGAVGNLIGAAADGIGKLFGVEASEDTLFKKMEKFGAVKLDAKNIKSNAEAMVAYGGAMALGAGGTTLAAVGTLASGAIGGLGKLIGGVPPLEAMQKFGLAVVNKEGVINNAEAMMEYLKAMALGAAAMGMKAVAALANTVSSVLDGVSKAVGGKGVLDAQISGMQKISKAQGISKDKILIFAGAALAFSGAMAAGAVGSVGKAIASAGNTVSEIMDGVTKALGGEGVLDAQISGMQKLSAATGIDVVKIKANAGAMVAFAGAMAAGAGGSGGKALGSVFNMLGGAFDGLTKMFGGKVKSPLDDLKMFAKTTVTDAEVVSIKSNGEGIKAYVSAMSGLTGLKIPTTFGDMIGNLMTGIGSIFTKDRDPMTDLETFAKKDIDPVKVKKNVQALQEFAKLGSLGTTRMSISRFTGDLMKSIPALEVAIMGGTVGKGWFSSGSKLKGLASPEIKFTEASKNVATLRASLGMETTMPGAPPAVEAASDGASTGDSLWNEKLTKSIDALTVAMLGAASGGGGMVNTSNTTINKKTQVQVTSPGGPRLSRGG